MTRTLATRPTPDRAPAGGFTLLEALVVLALLGLAMALVAPSAIRTIAAWERATASEEMLGHLAALPDRARAESRRLDFGPGLLELPGVAWPEGWRVELSAPLQVQPNGACSAGAGQLLGPEGEVVDFALEPPYCRIRLPGN